MQDLLENLSISEKIKSKTILIAEGDQAKELFYIQKGCIRAWFNDSGKETTLQFFFEGDTVTAFESFMGDKASVIYIETIENCEIQRISKSDFQKLVQTNERFKDWFYQTAISKLTVHSNRLLSLLKNKPYERYQELLTQNPEIIARIPQHYIASYLGITPVSLSRIRNRKS
ncbi:Crp/Fnr family transcriptional regulator [Fluviicola sp.]|uniref:Crp/Fnr family transcriptional regulator n=1 Tax=Fluviicola sp. TaxID=1917219 RepID=UPI0031DA1D40